MDPRPYPGPRPVDAVTAAAYVRHATGKSCAPATIRVWAFRGRLTRRGRRGRVTLYSLDELHDLVAGAPLDEVA